MGKTEKLVKSASRGWRAAMCCNFEREASGKVDTACFSLLVLKSTLSPKKVKKKAVLLAALFKQQCLKSVDLKKLK